MEALEMIAEAPRRAPTTQPHDQPLAGAYRRDLRAGFMSMVPLLPGDIPFAFAFTVIARSAGFSLLETQALSMLVYAGSAQLATVTLFAGGGSAIAIILTTLVLNLRHVLYGLSLDGKLERPSRPPRALLAMTLTDESYGITIKEILRPRNLPPGGRRDAFLLGASVCLYASFAVSTLLGALLGGLLPDPSRTGLSFIFPLMFLALLLPLLRAWRHLAVAGAAGMAAFSLSHFELANSGMTILLATVGAAALGACWPRTDTEVAG
jgi:4-azaleucine resistance transporter AzlC